MESPESLADFIEAAGSGSKLRVEADLGDGFYRLRTDEAERRQAAQDIRSSEDAVIEMLRNARDAHARNAFVATAREGSKRLITILDDGDGIPPSMHELVFEPRVTSKLDTMNFDRWGVHGRGMALFSIASNAVSARVVASDRGLGASIAVETDLASLPEKKDQSTFPTLILADEGTVAMRGPKNIVRTACEFALEQRRGMSVFFGSPSEIAATLYAYGTATLSARVRAFGGMIEDSIPVCKRLALSVDDVDFAEKADRIGLALSARTARRVLDGDIRPVPSLLERLEAEGVKAPAAPQPKARGTARKAKPQRDAIEKTRFDRKDLEELGERIKDAYGELASAYYLDPNVDPNVVASGGSLHVTIPVVRQR